MSRTRKIKRSKQSLLDPRDPGVCDIVKGNSPLIISGPHNGYFVPQSLHDDKNYPLGLHPSAFDPKSPFKRHEACDWGIAELFDVLQEMEAKAEPPQKHNYISSPYSRLISDLNRPPEHSMSDKSSEDRSIIPGNIDIDKKHKTQRIADIYTPYHKELKKLITQVQKRFGYAIFLDLHSFTPTWKGKNRAVHIGTLACSDNFTESHISKYLAAACAAHNLNFGAHQPYDLKNEPKEHSDTARTIEEYGVWYAGLEIRNDLLSTPENTKMIAELIFEATTSLTNYHDTAAFTTKTSKTKKPLVSA